MSTNETHARSLVDLLGLRVDPVAITFSAAAPEGVSRVAAPAPAGCAYWSRAARGEVFYTTGEDHLGCAIGAYTHGVELDAAKGRELEEMLGTMAGLQYLTMAEVPTIPARKEKLGAVTYAPLAKAPVAPDLVLVRGTARVAMLLAEAAHAAGVDDAAATGLRPACALVPRVVAAGRAASSLGCIGNRVYTGLGDDEMWYGLPGAHMAAVVGRLAVIVKANHALENHHRARLDLPAST